MTVGPAFPGETREEFVARIIAAAPAPTSELMAFIRPLLPPLTPEEAQALIEAQEPLGRAS